MIWLDLDGIPTIVRNSSLVRVQSCHCTRGGDGDDVGLKITTIDVGEETSILLRNVLEQELLRVFTHDLATSGNPLFAKLNFI